MEMDGISPEVIKDSLCLECNRQKIFSAGESAGASGSFFFFSKDKTFLIKTINQSEKKLLYSILNGYVSHLQRNPNSLIARIYGVYTIKSSSFGPLSIMLM